MRNLKPFSFFVFFFGLACERIFTKTQSIENRCYRTKKYTVWRRARASFSPEILHAGAVKGLRSCGGSEGVKIICSHSFYFFTPQYSSYREDGSFTITCSHSVCKHLQANIQTGRDARMQSTFKLKKSNRCIWHVTKPIL